MPKDSLPRACREPLAAGSSVLWQGAREAAPLLLPRGIVTALPGDSTVTSGPRGPAAASPASCLLAQHQRMAQGPWGASPRAVPVPRTPGQLVLSLRGCALGVPRKACWAPCSVSLCTRVPLSPQKGQESSHMLALASGFSCSSIGSRGAWQSWAQCQQLGSSDLLAAGGGRVGGEGELSCSGHQSVAPGHGCRPIFRPAAQHQCQGPSRTSSGTEQQQVQQRRALSSQHGFSRSTTSGSLHSGSCGCQHYDHALRQLLPGLPAVGVCRLNHMCLGFSKRLASKPPLFNRLLKQAISDCQTGSRLLQDKVWGQPAVGLAACVGCNCKAAFP